MHFIVIMNCECCKRKTVFQSLCLLYTLAVRGLGNVTAWVKRVMLLWFCNIHEKSTSFTVHTLSAYSAEHTFIIYQLWTKHSEVIVQWYQWNIFLTHQQCWPKSDLLEAKKNPSSFIFYHFCCLYHKNEPKYNNSSGKRLNLQTHNSLTVSTTGLLF